MDGDNKLVDSKTDQPPAETSGSVTTMASSKYQYESLPSEQHVRMAIILPGEADASLRCQVVSVPLQAMPEIFFEAISYVWGDENDTTTIEVEPPTYSKRFLSQKFGSRTTSLSLRLRYPSATDRQYLHKSERCG